MKKFAFFLPQFHEIPENDEWWGEGFTEWTNVKSAKPLFKGHKQPQAPLNDNYYNLLDKSTVVWQTQLMKKYHVDGLIYYHYYFRGKKLLEKPAENLLQWKDIEQPFFFCWANHDWNRSWNGTRELLQKQEYGNEKDWEEHFLYLLPFFEDNRYLKVDNKPVFMLFKCDFPEKNKMFLLFNNLCIQHGFSGIYLIETFNGGDNCVNELNKFKDNISSVTKRIFLREHLVSASIYSQNSKYIPVRIVKKIRDTYFKMRNGSFLNYYDANVLYHIITHDEPQNKEYIHGLIFTWDNTPRHKERGNIVTPPSKKSFFQLMNKLKFNDLIFINAWNEWAEGMVLEPTKENGYKYLEWLKEWTEENEEIWDISK